MRGRRFVLLLAAVLVLPACAGTNAPETALVQIRDGGYPGGGPIPGWFEPAALVIAPGTEVRWRNDGALAYNVTTAPLTLAGQAAIPAGAQPWDSGPVWPGGTFAHRFDTRGTYVYWSDRGAQQMVATIRVEDRP